MIKQFGSTKMETSFAGIRLGEKVIEK